MTEQKKRLKHRPSDQSLSRRVKFTIRNIQDLIKHPRFHRLKVRCNGMMMAVVYKRIYDEISRQPDGDIIEIGGAGGAGSITAALAKKESGKAGRIITVERMDGRSRLRYGGYKDNLEIFQEHVAAFGVQDRIRLFPHLLTMENASEVLALVETEKLSALMCDADGRIDRDFKCFVPRLVDGGLFVVDDYVRLRVHDEVLARPMDFRKFFITVRLLDKMIEWGIYEPIAQVRGTAFGRKPPTADVSRIDLDECQRIVDEVHASLGIREDAEKKPVAEPVAS